MHKGFLKLASFFALIAVILGASGTHALKNVLSETSMEIFDTAVRYQFYHAIALFITAILYKEFASRFLRIAGVCFSIGIFLFSGSLYALTYIKNEGLTEYNWVGFITPAGGTLFMIGWILIMIAVRNSTAK